MHIGKPTRKAKEHTIGKFMGELQNPNYVPGQPKRQVGFIGLNDDKETVKATIAQAEAQQILNATIALDKAETDIDARKQYNSGVTTLNPKYSTLQPNSGFILRCFIMTGDEILGENSTLFIGTGGLPKIPVRTRNGQAVWREVTDKFAYRGKAVIVAVPSNEKEYQPGDIVQINAPRTICPMAESDFQIVEFNYLHPDSRHINPPTNVTDEDFGYIIIPRSEIILRLPKP